MLKPKSSTISLKGGEDQKRESNGVRKEWGRKLP